MATVSGLSVQQAQAQLDALRAQGKTESISKEAGKLADYIKTLEPERFGAESVARAKEKLAYSMAQPPAATTAGTPTSGAGLGFSTTSAGAPIDLNKIYESALQSEDIKNLEKELTTKKDALNRATTDINDNPFYSEATRVGKIAKLNDQAQREISTLEGSLAQRKADAQVKVNIATQQYNIQNQEYQNNISRLNLLISSGALLNASGSDIANIAMATGMSTGMVNGIISKMKTEQIKPTIINDTDDAGNVTVAVLDANTGKVISQTSLGKIGKSKTVAEGITGTTKVTEQQAAQVVAPKLQAEIGGDGHVSENTYIAARNAWASLGLDPAAFDSQFGYQYVNPNYYESYKITNDKVLSYFRGY